MDNIIVSDNDNAFVPNELPVNLQPPETLLIQENILQDGGIAATINVGSTTTLDPDTPAYVNNIGDEKHAILQFGIPKGESGADGVDGVDGEAATITVGSTTTIDHDEPASVVNTGTSQNAQLDFYIPQGVQGEQGEQGISPRAYVEPTAGGAMIYIDDYMTATNVEIHNGVDGHDGQDGQAATITVGSTTTGAAGSNASVVNSGTSSAAVLDFTIPRGNDGAAGADGYSPTATVVQNTGSATITITDKNGTTTATVYDGSSTTMSLLSYGHSTWNDFITAYNSNSIVYCRASSNANPATGSQTRLAFMAYVNNASTPTSVEFQYYRSIATHSDSQQGDQVYVYKLTSTSGGTWSVEVRSAFTKIAAGTNMTSSYTSGTLTLNATQPTVPTKTSDLTNDGADGTSTYVEADDLATVATTGAYSDLSGTPTIPTATSDLTNDGADGTSTYVEADDLASVATTGVYSDLSGTPTIPTKTSDLTNDGADGTSTYVEADDLASVATSGSFSDLSGTITTAQIANGAVTNAKTSATVLFDTYGTSGNLSLLDDVTTYEYIDIYAHEIGNRKMSMRLGTPRIGNKFDISTTFVASSKLYWRGKEYTIESATSIEVANTAQVEISGSGTTVTTGGTNVYVDKIIGYK